MSRYIDADALVKDLESKKLVFTDTITVADALRAQGREIRKAIEDAPTADVVDVVRCKDCLYVHFNSSSERYTCQRAYPRRWVEEDDFCNHGRIVEP